MASPEADLARARIAATCSRIEPPDEAAGAAARARQAELTKPSGSLGRLEELSIQVAGTTGRARPRLPRKAVIVMAADHGVTAEGVSAYPADVTPQMVANFLRGGAAINALARVAGARVVVVDMGVAVELPPHPGLERARIGAGTANLAIGPAMSLDDAALAVAAGIGVLERLAADGLDLVATGDMGIGNTTASSAITAVIAGASAAVVAGRGTGLDDAGLAAVGGFEIGGLAGVILGAAAARIPVLLDGFISGAAALVAATICPAVRPHLVAAHVSVEAGHRVALDWLGLRPLLDLGLRLGEGTGAVLAMPIVDAALAALDEMATFAEAAVAGPLDGAG